MRSRTKAIWLIAIIASVGRLDAGEPPTAQDDGPEGRYSEQILWGGEEVAAEALFVPLDVLRDTDIEDLPVAEHERDELRRRLYEWEDFSSRIHQLKGFTPNRCTPGPSTVPPGSLPEASTLAEQILFRDLALLGEVVAVVPGWRTGLGRVGRLVYFSVVDILQDRKKEVVAGQVFGFFQVGGTLNVDEGSVLCTPEPEDVPQFAEGDRVLVVGNLHPGDERLVYSYLEAAVDDGIVEIPSSGLLTEAGTKPLAELRSKIRSLRGDEP